MGPQGSDEVYPKVNTICADSDSLLYTSSTTTWSPFPNGEGIFSPYPLFAEALQRRLIEVIIHRRRNTL